jgi:hypothetical protein
MPQKKAARATKKAPRRQQKPTTRKTRKTAKPASAGLTAAASGAINQPPAITRQARQGREPLSESNEEQPLQKEFLAFQQSFLNSIQESADLLRQAAQDAVQSIRAQSAQATTIPLSGQPGAPENPLNLTSDFVNKAFQQTKDQAQKMFDEIGKGTPPTPSIPPPPTPAQPAAPVGVDPLAASALLMNQAMQHLNAATEAVMKEVDRRLSNIPVASAQTPNVAAAAHKPLA